MKRLTICAALLVASCSNRAENLDREIRKETTQASSTKVLPAPVEVRVPCLPDDQTAFIAATTSANHAYREAANAIKKTALRAQRAQAIKAALGDKRQFADWTSRLMKLETTSEGKAYVTFRIAPDLHVKTWNNDLSDFKDKTLIAQSNPIYAILAELKEGEIVHISGEFLPAERDFVKEASLSEEGSMKSPEFIVRLSSVAKSQVQWPATAQPTSCYRVPTAPPKH